MAGWKAWDFSRLPRLPFAAKTRSTFFFPSPPELHKTAEIYAGPNSHSSNAAPDGRWPAGKKENAGIRKEFGLPADKAFKG